MDNNNFNKESKEQLEREIEELKRQKEIRDLQKQKEKLKKTAFDSMGGSIPDKKEKETLNETALFLFKKKNLILGAVTVLLGVVVVWGIFYFQAKKKRNKGIEVIQAQNMSSVTTPQEKVNNGSGKEIAESILKGTIESLQKGDYSSMITDKDELEAMNIFSNAYKKINYKINNVTETQDKVVLNVTMKYPDLSEIPTLVNKKVINNVQQLQGKSDAIIEQQTMKWMKELVDQKLNDTNLKYLEETFDMTYVKVNDEWTTQNEENLNFNRVMKFNIDM